MTARTQPMTGAPEGASTDPRRAATFTADGTGQMAAPAAAVPAAPEAARTEAAPAPMTSPATQQGVEDTRARMDDPSRSADHAEPGEAVPSSEPAPAAQPAPGVVRG